MRLARVLDDKQVVSLGELANRVHVDHLAVQVNRYDRLGGGSERLRERVQVHEACRRVHVYEHWARPAHHNRFRRGGKRVRGRDDLVARPDPVSAQREVQGVGAGGHADRVSHSDELGELALEGLDLFAEREAAPIEDALERLAEGGVQRLVQSTKVYERYFTSCDGGQSCSPLVRVQRAVDLG